MNIKCNLHIKIDEKREEAITKIEGNLPCVLTGLSMLAKSLRENKVPKELIMEAVKIGLTDNKKEEKNSQSNLNAEDFIGIIKILKEMKGE